MFVLIGRTHANRERERKKTQLNGKNKTYDGFLLFVQLLFPQSFFFSFSTFCYLNETGLQRITFEKGCKRTTNYRCIVSFSEPFAKIRYSFLGHSNCLYKLKEEEEKGEEKNYFVCRTFVDQMFEKRNRCLLWCTVIYHHLRKKI